jgi:hypothetical protein
MAIDGIKTFDGRPVGPPANAVAPVNPELYKAPANTSGILAAAMPTTPTVAPTKYTAPTMTAATGTAGGYTGQGYDAAAGAAAQGQAQGYNANQAGVTDWNVDANQTVAGQLDGILAANNPLMQRAQTRANQDMAARGLLNSSMAVGAGQAALYDAALPIAQADAGTFGAAAKTNAGEANTTARFNTDAVNTAGRFNAGEANTMTGANVAAQNQQVLANQAATNRAGEYSANATNQASEFSAAAGNQQTLANQQAAQQANQFNAQQQAAAAQFEAETGFKSQLANQDAGVKTALTQYDAALKMQMQNVDSATRVQLQAIDAETRQVLANTEAQFKQSLQSSAAMTQTYQDMVEGFTKIMQDPEMDGPNKIKAFENLTALYNNQLAVQEQISGLDLGQFISPSTFGVGPSAGNGGQVDVGPIMGGEPYVNPVTGVARGNSTLAE